MMNYIETIIGVRNMDKQSHQATWIAVPEHGTYYKYDSDGTLLFSPMLTDGKRGTEVGEVDLYRLDKKTRRAIRKVMELKK
jgi:hypothetical protein